MLIKRNKIVRSVCVVVILGIILLCLKIILEQPQSTAVSPSQTATHPQAPPVSSAPISSCATEINGKPNLGEVCSINELQNQQKQQSNLS